jgi:outer membrane receptor protein involved in Fe transport
MLFSRGPRSPAAFRRWGLLALLLLAGVHALAQDPPAADTTHPVYRGRPLVEVIGQLRERGLKILYSSAVVADDLLVTVEPRSTEPRQILEEILVAAGLVAQPGPGGALLILPAAPQVTLEGRVLSAARGTPVSGAFVHVAGASAGATTRPDGTFALPGLSAGSYDLVVDAAGFHSRTMAAVDPAARDRLTIWLEPQPAFAEQVVVTPSLHELGAEEPAPHLTIAREDARLVPATGGDLGQVLENIPGIAAPDGSAAFYARGAEARDVSLILDGLELYAPYHMQGFQSPFSLVDSTIVDTIDYLGGGFTADFGDRHGGFVDLSTTLPVTGQHGLVELGTVNSRGGYSMMASDQSLLVSARAWYPEAFTETMQLGEPGFNPRFADLYLKFSSVVTPTTVLSFHGLLATDSLDFTEEDGNEAVTSTETSAYLWARALRAWTPAVFSRTVISGGRLERTREGISEPEDVAIAVDDRRNAEFFGLTHDQSWKLSDRHLIKGGFLVRSLGADYRYETEPEGSPATALLLEPSGSSYAAYAAHRAAWSGRFATELGVRWDHQTYTRDGQMSPRLNLLWRPAQRTEVQLGLGRFFQSQRIHELHVESGETQFRPAELSQQIDVTMQHRARADWSVRLDAYYGTISHPKPRYENLFNPIELFPETEEDWVTVAPARARLRGAEVLVRSESAGALHWWASYAWSKADDVIGGEGVPRSWDQTHAGKFLLAYRLGERWLFSGSGSAHTGWPTTPVTGEIVSPGNPPEIEPVVGARNSDRFPDYLRIDLKVERTFALPLGRLRLDLVVMNVTDRENVCCVDDFSFQQRPDGSIETTPELNSWLGRTPSFSVLWDF